jgi:DNA-binding MarR family transcriptional regulator
MKNKGCSPAASPSEALFHSLLRIFGLVRQVQEPYFARFGISSAQWAVLRVLQRAESEGQGQRGLRLSEVGQRLFIQPPSVTGVVDRLERRGLVKRSESASDLRVRCLELTQPGRKLLAKVLVNHSGQIDSLFGGLTPEERQSLFNLLRPLEKHLRTLISLPPEVQSGKMESTRIDARE